MTTLPLPGITPPQVPPGVPTRDRWRTPAGVLAAPLDLLGRDRYDMDAAAEEGAHVAERWIGVEDDALRYDWTSAAAPGSTVWLNPPFSAASGGKGAWVDCAVRWSGSYTVCLYLPCYADGPVAQLDGICSARIGYVGRVRHEPPPGIMPSSPEAHQHACWILGGPELGGVSLAWDWRSMRWIGRRPGPEGAP